MAGNLKGQGGIKGLLLLHGEKIAISLVGLVALWLIYKATSLPRLKEEFQATKLREQITETSNAVSRSTWPEPTDPAAAEVRPAKQLNEKSDAPVPLDPYKIAVGLDNAIVTPTHRRPDPVLVNAVDVRASGGSGLFAIIDEAVRKRRDLELAKDEAERAKKEADRQEKEQKANDGGEAGPVRRNRNPDAEAALEPFDPDHPKRRPLDGQMFTMGVPLQGGERIEQAYWAIVTAKVPIREQLKLYQDAFEKATGGFDPARDFPSYKGYLVQRAEVVAGKDLDWKAVPVYDGQRKSITAKTPISPNGVGEPVMIKLEEKMLEWAGRLPDVIDARFADYILTFPLPPLVGRDWGAEATHPDIPLIADTPPLEEEIAPLPTTAPEATPAVPNEDSTFAAAGPPGAVPGMGQFPGARPGVGMGRGEFGTGRGRMMDLEGGMGRPMMGGRGFGGPEGGPRGGGGFSGGMAGAARTSLPKGVDFLLLRFFDFTVEPGKKYKYRVQLVLADPNYAALPNTLSAEVLDRQAKEAAAAKARNTVRSDIRRIEAWSDPSPTVGIPLAGSVKLADVKASADEKINDEPSTTLIVESFGVDDAGNAIQASAKKKDLRRGFVANMVEDAKYLGDGWTDVQKGAKFVTGMTVLDMDGGKQLTKDYKTPGRILLMGPSGELYIRNELDDKPAAEYYDMLFENEHKGPALEGGLEDGPGGRGRGRRGGGR